MARIRTIKPETPQSETLGRVSRDARLLFLFLWTVCDDEGRTRAASRLLASLLFPYDDDAPEKIDGWLAELEGIGAIRRYVDDGSTYLDIPKWLKHQKIDHKTSSKLPAFREDSRILAKPSESLAPDLDLDLDQEGIGKSVSSAPAKPADAEPPVFLFPVTGAGVGEWPLTRAQVDEWQVLYPALDVLAEARKALAWVTAAKTNRKTYGGMPRFLVNWLSRATDRPRGHGTTPAAPARPRSLGPDYAAVPDWFDECKALHGGLCGSRNAHSIQLDIDAARAARTQETTHV